MLVFFVYFLPSTYGAISEFLKVFDFESTENCPKHVDQFSKDSTLMEIERTFSW